MLSWMMAPTLPVVKSAITTVATLGLILKFPPWRSNPAFTWQKQWLKCWCHTELGSTPELIARIYE